MKKIISILLASSVLAVCFTFSACQKGDKGDTGPAGPTGATGATGPSGSANVTTTNYTATPGNWNTSGAWWYIDVPVSSLTDASKDLVQVYVQLSSGGSYWAMPAKDVYFTGDNYQFAYNTGTVTLWYNYTSAPSST